MSEKKKEKQQKSRRIFGKYTRRCAVSCALLFGFMTAAQPLALAVQADTVTEDSIKEKENQIEAAKKERQQVQSSISDLKNMKASLESKKADLNTYVTQLDSKLTQIQQNIDSLKQQIEDKEADITKTETELQEAEDTQQEQYENMKKRCQFIYEKGDTYMMEILLKSASFGDLLNKAYYIEQLSNYDQNLLSRYKEQTKLVAATKEALEEEKQTLDDEKKAVEEEESNMTALISEKKQQIASTESEIAESASTIEEYEAQMNQQTSAIAALEASVAADKQALANQRKYSGGAFTWPAPSYTYISSEFGYRVHPIYGRTIFHSGLDLAAPSGSPILAAADGVVVAATYESSMGNYVMINHGDGLYTIYMHASALYVSAGQEVSAGQQIAAVGSTGNSTGPHLHFSVRLNGSYVSPWNYLGK